MKRLNIGFISFLMLLSLVCIGFSSWNIVYDQSDSVIGNIDVDEILPNVITTEYECFKYYGNKFLSYSNDSNENTVVDLSDTGYISINIKFIDIDKIKSYKNPTLNLLLEEKSPNNISHNIINNTYITNVSFSLNDSNFTASSLIFNNNTLNVTYSLNFDSVNLSDATYVLKIEFKVTDENRDAFFESLFLDNVTFSYLVTVEEG